MVAAAPSHLNQLRQVFSAVQGIVTMDQRTVGKCVIHQPIERVVAKLRFTLFGILFPDGTPKAIVEILVGAVRRSIRR